jgi:SAM-dependent methyltransferase
MANAACTSYGDLLLGIGHVDQAIPLLGQALRAWRVLDNDFMLVHTLHSMGMACVDKVRLARAEAHFRNALRVAARSSIAVLLPRQGIALATVLRLTGRIVGNRHSEAVALRETAFLTDGSGDPPGSLLTAALEIYRDLGDVRGQVDTLAALGAAHMLYYVPDRRAAVSELRRVLAPAGVCIAVTNGGDHLRTLCAMVESAARKSTPGWSMRAATQAFTSENAAAQLGHAFASVTPVRPALQAPAVIRDASVVADYVASWAGFYQDQVARPWADVVAGVRQEVQAVIDHEGTFTVSDDLAAFVCR